jgi:hypothetical protein
MGDSVPGGRRGQVPLVAARGHREVNGSLAPVSQSSDSNPRSTDEPAATEFRLIKMTLGGGGVPAALL